MRTIITSAGPPAPVAAEADTARPYTGRRSEARDLIAEAAASMPGAFTVDALAAVVSERRPSTGLATVYRAVAAMVSAGWLERVGEREGTALFARCGSHDHHHHLVCTGCGATVATDCPVDARLEEAAALEGFTVTGHEVRLYGLCGPCGAAAGAKPDAAGPAGPPGGPGDWDG